MNSDASKATLANDLSAMFASIVGESHVRAATAEDSVDGVRAKTVVSPGTPAEVAEVVKTANGAGLAILPRGAGTKRAWGTPPRRADLILSLARLNRLKEHAWADLTVSVEPGCTVGELQKSLAV